MSGKVRREVERSPSALTSEQVGYIRKRIAERGYGTVAGLSRAMGVSYFTLYKTLSGERGASVRLQRLLAQALGDPWPTTFTEPLAASASDGARPAPAGLPPLPTIALSSSPAELRRVARWLLEYADFLEAPGGRPGG